jgi:hypothetical protein
MTLIRIIFLFIIAYLAIKLFRNLLGMPSQKSEIKGKPQIKKPLDLSDADIEDADYEDIKD